MKPFATLALVLLLSETPALADCTLGQFTEKLVDLNHAITLPNNIPPLSIIELDLPDGDWDVEGNVVVLPVPNSGSSISLIERHVTTEMVPNILATPSPNYGASNANHSTNLPNQAEIILIGNKRYNVHDSITGITPVYGTVIVTWTGSGHFIGYGYLRARCYGPHS
jgi:hypothetical protein